MRDKAVVRILFVCLGNICRSPMAEGVFRRMLEDAGLVAQVFVDSAGTAAYHVGSPPDRRGQEAAARRGADLRRLRARVVEAEDFEVFDYLLAMDQNNYEDLLSLCPLPEYRGKIRLFMDYAPELPDREVPDPYYGGLGGFERVLDLVEAASYGLMLHLREHYRM